MSDVLVLDATGMPIYTTGVRDALRLWNKDKAVVLEEDREGKLLHSGSFEMGMPRVVQLRNWVARKLNVRVPLNRRNVIVRDSVMRGRSFTLICQYCADPLTTETYSLDHILPRSRGGLTEWTNIVACCKDCNFRKADRTPEEAGMKLLKRPVEPYTHDPKFTFRLHIRNPRPEWESYLYWNVELDK
jgi:5-methylcytosine-specific restriction endonuclease McrA